MARFLPNWFSSDIAIDLGTSNTLLFLQGRGIVINEPSVVAVDQRLVGRNRVVAVGREAKDMLGRTPGAITAIRPIQKGVISDFDAETALVHKFMEKSVHIYLKGMSLLKPQMRALASIPYVATEIEQKAVEEILLKLGFSSVFLIEKPIAAALGAGINVFYHHPHLLIDMGGGLTELSIVSGGGIVAGKTLKSSGDAMNHTLAHYAYLKYGIILGEATCEYLKLNVLNFSHSNKTLSIT